MPSDQHQASAETKRTIVTYHSAFTGRAGHQEFDDPAEAQEVAQMAKRMGHSNVRVNTRPV